MTALYYNGTTTQVLIPKYIKPLERGLIPKSDIVANMMPLKKKMTGGEKLLMKVMVAPPQGVTSISHDDSGSSYNDHIQGSYVDAYVNTKTKVMTGQIAQDLMDRIEDGDGTQQDINTLKDLLKDYITQLGFFREVSLLHGGNEVFTLESTVTTDNGTTQVWQVTAATWSGLMAERLLNAKVDAYTSGGTKINTTGEIQITNFDADNRTLTFTGVETELDSLGDAEIFTQGGYGKDCEGIFLIAGSTTSTIHNLSQLTYPLWKSKAFAVGSEPMSYAVLLKAVTWLKNRGARGNFKWLCSANQEKDVMVDIITLTKQSGMNGASFDNQLRRLNFSGGFSLDFVSHPYCKQGESAIFSPMNFERLGTDINLHPFDKRTNLYLMPSAVGDYVSFKVRYYGGLLCRKPNMTVKFTGISSVDDV